MTPDDSTDVCSTGYVLADVGNEYITFTEANANFTIKQLVNGIDYDFIWWDADAAVVGSSGSFTASGTTEVFNPPSTNMAIHIWRQ
jgi:hypothetical protein